MITSKSAALGDGDRFCASASTTIVKKTPRQKRFRFIALIQEAPSNDVDLKTFARKLMLRSTLPSVARSTNLSLTKSRHGDRAPCMLCAAVRATHASWFDRPSPNERDMSMERNCRRRTQHEFRHRDRAESARALCRKSLGTSPPSCNRYPLAMVPKVA